MKLTFKLLSDDVFYQNFNWFSDDFRENRS